MNDVVSLVVNNRIYEGWLGAKVSISMMKFSRDFALSLTRSHEAGAIRLPTKVGDEVRIDINGKPMVTGYVTSIDTQVNSSSVSVTVKGFSKTIDLCECNVPPGEALAFKRMSISAVMQKLAGHYGIKVKFDASINKVIDWDISPTDTIQSSLVKLIQQHTLSVCDDGDGCLVVSNVGAHKADDTLSVGKNVLNSAYSLDGSGVYSHYVVLGQGANPDSTRPVEDGQLKAVATFEYRKRYNVTAQTGNAITAELNKRAKMIRDFKLGSAETYKCTVQGWAQTSGELWAVNHLVRVIDPFAEIDKYLLISDVSFNRDSSGTTTELTLKPLGAFIETNPPKEKSSKSGSDAGKGWDLKNKGTTQVADWVK